MAKALRAGQGLVGVTRAVVALLRLWKNGKGLGPFPRTWGRGQVLRGVIKALGA